MEAERSPATRAKSLVTFLDEATGPAISRVARHWSTTDKLRLVAETEEAGTSVRAVAARHGICESLLFTWRRQVREGALVGALDIPMFVPVQMISGATTPPSPSAGHPVRPASVSRAAAATGVIEIELANGQHVRVGSDVNLSALRRVLAALRE
jgi:transposase